MGWVAEELAEKSLNAVIQNVAKDPGSSRRSAKRVNFGGSSPKIRAQNDSTNEFPATCEAGHESVPSTQHPVPSAPI